MSTRTLRLSLIAGAACALLLACGGSGSSDPASQRGDLRSAEPLITLSAAQLNAFIDSQGLQPITGSAVCDVTLVALDYHTVGARDDEDTNVTGVMLLPAGTADPACSAEAPLLAYARGTEVSKKRALASPEDGETLMLAAFFAAQGYAVVATDYLGYAGSSYSFHPYLHADSEASAVLDSVRAARQAAPDLGTRLSGQLMFSGYSQGGHASMAAQRAAERDHPGEFPVTAGAHLAGPYNLSGAMQMEQAIAGYQFFVPFMVTSWQKVYGNVYDQPEDVFLPPYLDGIESLLPSPDLDYTSLVSSGKLPDGTPDQARDALFTPDFLQQLQSGESTPVLAAAADNTLFDWQPVAPVLLCGGAGDPTVPPAVHQAPMMAYFADQGAQNVQSVDVDPQIQASFAPGGQAPTDPQSPEFAAYYGAYHGSYEPLFCMAAARGLFEQVRH